MRRVRWKAMSEEVCGGAVFKRSYAVRMCEMVQRKSKTHRHMVNGKLSSLYTLQYLSVIGDRMENSDQRIELLVRVVKGSMSEMFSLVLTRLQVRIATQKNHYIEGLHLKPLLRPHLRDSTICEFLL
ncbi:hypothetical protein Mapa_001506 [Marchantia paleacea]|nr:hypothetical protein Mapa_001506 [Marchantia paleacea]